jgi:hypothetical protein
MLCNRALWQQVSAACFTPDSKHVLVGDKFGDVFVAEVVPDAEGGGAPVAAEASEDSNELVPLLGHYCAIITALCVDPSCRCARHLCLFDVQLLDLQDTSASQFRRPAHFKLKCNALVSCNKVAIMRDHRLRPPPSLFPPGQHRPRLTMQMLRDEDWQRGTLSAWPTQRHGHQLAADVHVAASAQLTALP